MSDEQPELITLNESDVLHYLAQNVDLFARNPEALVALTLPHQQKGSISLLERQQEILRAKNKQLEAEKKQLVATAKSNEKIYKAFINLYMALIEDPDSEKLMTLLKTILIDQIKLDGVKLYLFTPPTDNKTDYLVNNLADFNDVLSDRLARDTYYFGRLKQQEMDLFFQAEQRIGSVCLIRLGAQKDLGLLIFGSRDEHHFSPEMDTVFLAPMVKLINRILFN